MKKRNAGLLSLCVIIPLLCGGCASLVEKTGRLIDGSASAEKTTAVYKTVNSVAPVEMRVVRNKAGEHSIILLLEKYPAIKLFGSMPDEKAEFYLTSLYYLGGNRHGWNEYCLDLSGTGSLTLGETPVTISVHPEIEAVQISSGRIRRFDTLITGSEALANLRNRRERILALTEWMNSQENTPRNLSLIDFEKHWKPLLFPEIATKKTRPANWQQKEDQWHKSEDIRWNTSYTERILPEELWNIRNSGTMLRDWEEALKWVYLECEWGNITELLSRQIILQKVK